MKELINFISNHYDELLQIMGALVMIASIIVKWTPSNTDNEVLNKIITIMEKLSVFNTKENQEKIDCFVEDNLVNKDNK